MDSLGMVGALRVGKDDAEFLSFHMGLGPEGGRRLAELQRWQAALGLSAGEEVQPPVFMECAPAQEGGVSRAGVLEVSSGCAVSAGLKVRQLTRR